MYSDLSSDALECVQSASSPRQALSYRLDSSLNVTSGGNRTLKYNSMICVTGNDTPYAFFFCYSRQNASAGMF